MDHDDHVWLIRRGLEGGGRVWADLGAGTGAFTLALADVLGRGGEIYAVDRDARAQRTNEAAVVEHVRGLLRPGWRKGPSSTTRSCWSGGRACTRCQLVIAALRLR